MIHSTKSLPLGCMRKRPKELDKRFVDLGGSLHNTMLDALEASFGMRGGGSFARYLQRLTSKCPIGCVGAAPQATRCFNLCMRALQQYDPARSTDPWKITEKILEEDGGI